MKRVSRKVKARQSIPYPAHAAMLRAAKRAREEARRFGTPIYVMKGGKIVALKP